MRRSNDNQEGAGEGAAGVDRQTTGYVGMETGNA